MNSLWKFCCALLHGIALALSFTLPIVSNAQDSYAQLALKGAKSVSFKFSEIDSAECPFRHDVQAQASVLLQELASMGLQSRADKDIPDLTVLVLLEAKTVRIGNSGVLGCSLLVKVQVIHSMLGHFRYWNEDDVIRAQAYQEISHDVKFPDQVDNSIKGAALELIARFNMAYYLANAQPKRQR